ncbi:MAG TPA: diguanylate cyclase [Caproiciproducens sp.]|nr:diguanylate cyclase [Caproiciproducens sp.]
MKRHILYSLVLLGAVLIDFLTFRSGIYGITQHLYYLPVLLGVFFYEEKGLYLAGLAALLYFLTVTLFSGDHMILTQTVVRCFILIGIADMVYRLNRRNKMQRIELLREHKWLETTLLSIGDGVVATDTDGIVRVINKEAENITGFSKSEVIGKNIREFGKVFDRSSDEKINFTQQELLEGTTVQHNEVYLFLPGGIKKDIDVKATAISLSNKEILGYVFVLRDVTEQKKNEAQIYYLTYHDKLTGLYNRRFVEEEISRLDVQRNLPISVMIGDVNGLKLVNDTFGHPAGDQLLIAAAKAISEACREDDIIARWGGDEFMVLLPHTMLQSTAQIAERIMKQCEEKHVGNIDLSISIGYATKTEAEQDIEKVIKRADDFMYQSKLSESRSVKNRAVQSILKTLIEKSGSEDRHSANVSKLCCTIGTSMGLTRKQIEDLDVLGKIHDIGKISIDQNILDKKGGLKPQEYEMVKKHSLKGYNIIIASPELSYLAESVLCHHERWDGAGYPNGVRGEEIPLYARILSVADAFEAMTSNRPYRGAMSQEEALKELKRCSGTQFDPVVVSALIK